MVLAVSTPSPTVLTIVLAIAIIGIFFLFKQFRHYANENTQRKRSFKKPLTMNSDWRDLHAIIKRRREGKILISMTRKPGDMLTERYFWIDSIPQEFRTYENWFFISVVDGVLTLTKEDSPFAALTTGYEDETFALDSHAI